jgi:glutathione S-transferase
LFINLAFDQQAADYNKQNAAPLPSTHQILLICELKDVHPTLIHIDIHQKNLGGFLNFNTSGKLPALLYGNGEPYKVIDEPEEIVDYLEKTYPDPPLKSVCKAALSKYGK